MAANKKARMKHSARLWSVAVNDGEWLVAAVKNADGKRLLYADAVAA
jgi:hypothetical protein